MCLGVWVLVSMPRHRAKVSSMLNKHFVMYCYSIILLSCQKQEILLHGKIVLVHMYTIWLNIYC